MRKFERRSSVNTTCHGDPDSPEPADAGFCDDNVSNFHIVYIRAAA